MATMQHFRADVKRAYSYATGSALARAVECARAPGLHAVAVYRLGQWSKALPAPLRAIVDPLYLLLNCWIKIAWGIDLSRAAQIGDGLYVCHFGGVTVSRLALIGRNCNLSHDVTIGVSGTGEACGVPVIGDNVYIGPGAKLFGKIRIGSNVKIGANAVVHQDVPDNSIVALTPGFEIISAKGNRQVVKLAA